MSKVVAIDKLRRAKALHAEAARLEAEALRELERDDDEPPPVKLAVDDAALERARKRLRRVGAMG